MQATRICEGAVLVFGSVAVILPDMVAAHLGSDTDSGDVGRQTDDGSHICTTAILRVL